MLATSKPVSRVLPKVIRTGFARMRCGCLIRQLPYLEAARNGAVRIRHAFANLVHHPYPLARKRRKPLTDLLTQSLGAKRRHRHANMTYAHRRHRHPRRHEVRRLRTRSGCPGRAPGMSHGHEPGTSQGREPEGASAQCRAEPACTGMACECNRLHHRRCACVCAADQPRERERAARKRARAVLRVRRRRDARALRWGRRQGAAKRREKSEKK